MNSVLLNFSLQRGIIICKAILFHKGVYIFANRMGLDTCSSYCLIKSESVDMLEIDFCSIEKTETAGITGKIELPKIIIDQIGVKEANAKNVEFLVGELPKELGLDGLLGYSFLKHFKITIDYKKEELTLVPN